MIGSPGSGGRALVPWPRMWRWFLAASLVAVITLTLPGSGQACPPRCECSAQLRSVSCQRRRLINIPEGIPTETQLLDLSKNRLRWVQAGDLAPYPRLEEVDLSENLIATLEPNAFATLQSLKVLKLRGNQLKLVPLGAFAKLGNLTSLDLSENKMVILLDYTFQDLRSLKHLEVGDNDLVYISHKAFSGLLGLEDLTIERCNLTSISGQTLSYLRSLVTLRLRHLSIIALEDQNFRKLSNLRGLDIDHWPYLEYISPVSFQGLDLHWLSITNTNITSVPSASFKNLVHLTHLNLSYNPISTLEPWAFKDLLRLKELIMVIAREGQPVSFLCRAEGEPAPAIVWISPQRRRITAKSSGRITVLPSGTLEIRYAQLTDSGTYICIASNAGGNDTYFATLTVRGQPLDAASAFFLNRSLYSGEFFNDTNLNSTRVYLKFTLDLTTILVSTAMGCITFLGVVLFCFLLLFVWSRGRGQRKNNFTVEYSFRKSEPVTGSSSGGTRKFNMKMI
ncbi:leucine-rich repeat and immunoglobulin-like domain-containing nogo receptor-interacting protein 3 isoform X2 [Perca fluviatilis]|uniref:leucine-rich repeat and immunoglobulin-like domain-containing nogo receptor-interacting protein 3 isoform X2 n=1 Tax=Perca fluviatilis TaxID=8168 RepID=UPI0019637891|nr:leucine-rich repeat and immunoglobulin-like domain-containing nogo receptor-interacting protein 3 isoform X2 [Perca fluviatilis]